MLNKPVEVSHGKTVAMKNSPFRHTLHDFQDGRLVDQSSCFGFQKTMCRGKVFLSSLYFPLLERYQLKVRLFLFGRKRDSSIKTHGSLGLNQSLSCFHIIVDIFIAPLNKTILLL